MEKAKCIVPDNLIINSRFFTASIQQSQILKIERRERRLHVLSENHEYSYYGSIDSLGVALKDSFLRCMQGCYINLERVEAMHDQKVIFDNGEIFSMGKNNFIRAKSSFSAFLKSKQNNQLAI